jgi:hypothetical protein
MYFDNSVSILAQGISAPLSVPISDGINYRQQSRPQLRQQLRQQQRQQLRQINSRSTQDQLKIPKGLRANVTHI